MSAKASIQLDYQYVTVELSAVELPEDRFRCDLSEIPQVRSHSSGVYSQEATKAVCISGMAHARRKLRLPHGLAITISEISGLVDEPQELGISLATAIAIAKALNKDVSLLYDSMGEWKVVE